MNKRIENDLKLCLSCKSEINKDAILCIKCNSFQNWKRHLYFGNSLFALLIAFISVLTVGLPIISDSMKSDNAELIFTPIQGVLRNITQEEALKLRGEGGSVSTDSILYSSGFFVQIVASNNGKRAGVVNKVEIIGLRGSRAELNLRWLDLIIIGERFSGSILINPNDTKILTAFYHRDQRSANDLDFNISEKKLRVKITFVDSYGVEKTIESTKDLIWYMDLPSI